MTYWENTGKYQTEAKELHKLIPSSGKCTIESLELLRLTSNAYYDIYNNGGCNYHKFTELFYEVSKYWEASKFNFEKKQQLIDFLAYVKLETESEVDCSGYLFQWGSKQTPFQKELLNVFEEFMDWVIITTYTKHKSES